MTTMVLNEIMPNPHTDYWTTTGAGSNADGENEYINPDGGSWVYAGSSSERSPTGYQTAFATPTPVPTPVTAGAVLNEIMPNPVSDYWTTDGTGSGSDTYNEYIEIYNTGSGTIDISGWTVKKDGSGTLTISGTSKTQNVPPGGHILIVRDDTYAEQGGPNITGSRSGYSGNWNTLGNDETYTISLHDGGGISRDSVTLPVPVGGFYQEDHPYYRNPDGGDWRYAESASEKSPTGYQAGSAALIDEGFDGFDTGTRPSGWTFTNCNLNTDTYTTAGNYGAASPSIKLDATGDSIETGEFTNPDWLRFWVKGQGAMGTAGLLVEEYYSADWHTLSDISVLSTTGTTLGDFYLASAATRLKFTFTRSTAGLAFDDLYLTGTVPLPTPELTSTPAPTPRPTPSIMPFSQVVINQVCPFGSPGEYIELYNRGSSPVNLNGWKLDIYTGDYTFTSADVISPKSFYLISDTSPLGIAVPDVYTDINIMDNGGSSFVRLLDGSSRVMDVVGWAGSAFYEWTRLGTLAGEKAWKRKIDGVDTNNNSNDFSAVNPDPRSGAGYNPSSGDFAKEMNTDIRLLAYNTEKNLLQSGKKDAFSRILRLIRPDVIVFEEIPDGTAASEIGIYLDDILDYGSPWDVHRGMTDGYNRSILASRYSLSLKRSDTYPVSSTRGVTIGLADLPDEVYPRDLYIMGVHLKAMGDSGSVAKRQKSCDAIAAWMGDARNAPQATNNYITLQSDTPMVVMGDFNFVAGDQPDITLRTGGIQDNTTYGPDVKGDWDNSDITDVMPANPYNGDPDTYPSWTWNPTGRLDRFYYTDSTASVAHSFILNSLTMNATQLTKTGLREDDTSESETSDHLPIVMDLRMESSSSCIASRADSGDFDGDGIDEIAIFRPTAGLWAVRGVTRLYFGGSTDGPVPGDYDGDGTTDIGIFRPASGLWAIKRVTRAYFGSASDTAVPGDYDGDGRCDPGIFRPSTGLWAIRGETRVYFGASGDMAVPGDYDGDGTKEIGIFRTSSALWALRGISRIYFGSGGDSPVPGDYDGAGAFRVGIFRGSSGLWAIRGVTRTYFGGGTDEPVPADYDGDGGDDTAIFRGSSGLWAARGVTRVYYGTTGDLPVTR